MKQMGVGGYTLWHLEFGGVLVMAPALISQLGLLLTLP